jgi:diacylglycerol kinase (ATP)
MRLLLLGNPAAAGGRAGRLLPGLRQYFSRHTSSCDYLETASAEELSRAAGEAAHGGYDRVVVAGGDGTLHAALNGLRGTDTALGVLPLGHGNDLARALGVPLDVRAAAEFMLRAPVSSIDVARVGEKTFGCVAGVGFDAETNRRANTWGPWPRGHARYFLAGVATLFRYRPLRVELVSDAGEFSGEVMWVAVANAPCYGGGVRIAPQAALDDGLLDVCVIERLSPLALLRLYPRLRRGQHLPAPCVHYFRCTRLQFREPVGVALFGDGEFLGQLPLEIRVEPAAARVVRQPT